MSAPAPFRFGVLGCASIASALIPAMRACPGVEVAAIASRDQARAQAFAEAWGIPLAFGSYQALLDAGVVDAIYNPLPNSLHAAWTIRALEAGLPVLCEKPLATSAAEARTIAAAAARAALPVAEAYMHRFHPLYDALVAALRAGVIGEIVTLAARFSFALDDWSEVPAQAELGGGALADVGGYPVTALRLLAGAEPVHVTAFARQGAVDHTLVGLLSFPAAASARVGAIGLVEASIEAEERHGLEITGTKGAILVERPWFPGEDAASYRLLRAGAHEVVAVPGGESYRLEVADFVAACREGRPPRWGVADAVATLAVMDALRASAAARGAPVAVS